MKTNVNFSNNPPIFSKEEYFRVIDTSFNQLGVKPLSQQIEEQPTVEEFFEMYNDLFYNIPEFGETNSHEFLIQKSSEYINFNPNQDEIIALQNEISQLREELLNTQKQLTETQTTPSNQI